MNDADLVRARLLDRLLERLLDESPAQREHHLRALAARQPDLAARLARLLALAEDESGAAPLPPAGALRASLAAHVFDDVQTAAAFPPGTFFCGYRIEGLIGRGGMSDVYRATRDFGDFSSTVALKLIHRGRNSAALRDYLRHERRALSRLDHPGIARFIDAGEGPGGDLYLAMEYVDGVAILDHADRRQLGVRARVDLLIELCRALEHAHARRLVHGDVKSANVLVDGGGRLRLVDFGIASDVDASDSDQHRAFTRECAAPEQVDGRETTTATDVFQVGALAFRLLAGSAHGEVASPVPRASSGAASGPAEERRARADARALSGHRPLVRILRGDLDAIIARCLHPDPEQRYGNCAELREDLQAWRRQRPVRARPGGAWLRVGKFLRRNFRAATIVAVVALALIATSTVFLYRLRQAELTRLAEADRAVRVEQFLADLFRTGSPYLRQDGRDPLAIFADLGASLLRESSDMDPRTRARVGLSLAQLQLARGDGQQARALLDEAAKDLDGRYEDAPLLGAEVLGALALGQSEGGEHERAIATQTEALRWLDHADAPARDSALARSLLADLLRRVGRNDEAGDQFARIMPQLLESLDPPTLDVIRAVDRYVRFLSIDNDLDALKSLQPILLERLESGASTTLAGAELTSTLAEIDSVLDGPVAAAARFEQAATRFEALLGARHPRVARALTDACVSNMEHGRMTVANDQCQRALAIYYQAYGPDSHDVGVISSNLGVIAYNTGVLNEADSHLQRAQRLTALNEQPFITLFVRLVHARVAIARGRHEQALAHLDRAEAIRTAMFADNASLALEIAEQRAFALIGLARFDEAETALVQTEAIMAGQVPADRQRNLVWADVARAQLAGGRGDRVAMESAIASALARYDDTPGRNDLERGWIHGELAAAAWSAGAGKRAAALYDQSLALMTPEANGAHWAMAWAGRRLAGGPSDSDRDQLARALLRDHGADTATARAYLAQR